MPWHPPWLKMIMPWTHLGPRWPRISIFHSSCAPNMFPKSIKSNQAFLRDPWKTSFFFSLKDAPKFCKINIQTELQVYIFLTITRNRNPCSRHHAALVFEVLHTSKALFSRSISEHPYMLPWNYCFTSFHENHGPENPPINPKMISKTCAALHRFSSSCFASLFKLKTGVWAVPSGGFPLFDLWAVGATNFWGCGTKYFWHCEGEFHFCITTCLENTGCHSL